MRRESTQRDTGLGTPAGIGHLVDTTLDCNVETHEGFRVALLAATAQGWDSPPGRAVLAALSRRAGSWGRTVRGGGSTPMGVVPSGEVLSIAWLTLNRFAPAVASAEAPWAYLWKAVQNALAVETAAATMLSSQVVRRARQEWPVGIQRLEDDDLERVSAARQLDGTSQAAQTRELSRTVVRFVELLVGDSPTSLEFWTDAVTRALDVMADARRSYEETELRRDAYLREVLGLGTEELAALGALLIGPRRGNRAAQSLLLALHRDPMSRPNDVTGAVARLELLRSRFATKAVGRDDAAA